jgi:hypothetical protein
MAVTLSQLSNDALLQTALQSLAVIFNKSIAVLQEELTHHKIICWHNRTLHTGRV